MTRSFAGGAWAAVLASARRGSGAELDANSRMLTLIAQLLSASAAAKPAAMLRRATYSSAAAAQPIKRSAIAMASLASAMVSSVPPTP